MIKDLRKVLMVLFSIKLVVNKSFVLGTGRQKI